jgi:hypothetical protein
MLPLRRSQQLFPLSWILSSLAEDAAPLVAKAKKAAKEPSLLPKKLLLRRPLRARTKPP